MIYYFCIFTIKNFIICKNSKNLMKGKPLIFLSNSFRRIILTSSSSPILLIICVMVFFIINLLYPIANPIAKIMDINFIPATKNIILKSISPKITIEMSITTPRFCNHGTQNNLHT